MKRSGMTILFSSIATLVFCSLGIISFYLMRSLLKGKIKEINFNTYGELVNHVFITKDTNDYETFSNLLKNLFKEDTNRDLTVNYFDDGEAAQAEMYELGKDMKNTESYAFGVTMKPFTKTENSKTISSLDILLYENATVDFTVANTVSISRLLWRYFLRSKSEKADIHFSNIRLLQRMADSIFSSLGPMVMCEGLLAVVPYITTPIIEDIRGETRSYMVSCTLRILPYWLAIYLVDYIYWFIVVTIAWLLFVICQIQAFLDNLFNTWFILVFSGFPFLLYLYCFSFLFSNPDSASRQTFLVSIIILILPPIIGAIMNKENPVGLDVIYSLFPHVGLYYILYFMTSRIGDQKKNLSFYFKEKHTNVYLIMTFLDIVLYGVILMIIEISRIALQRKAAKMNFSSYMKFFEEQKGRHPVTEEAQEMADLIHSDSDEEWAVKIKDVSRLFMNTAGKPIPAVNNVSLGVKKGSLFGFLGANGAGKTTLIRMITSLLPPSSGTIEIEGVDSTKMDDPTILSICPQFNSHLMNALTAQEHFTLFSYLFMLDEEEAKTKTNHLLECLGLFELKDKPIRELSGGDVRKLAIALCFLGPAKIILLDEPTASLDPVVRHSVHEMLIENKGEKTFMLCTHLLSEAETLCDTVSIMIKGNVYTVGSPAYLSQKFGTEFKVDIMLTSEDEEEGVKCDTFFAKEFPTSILSIKREKARIYSIPAQDTTLPDLFEKMKNGRDNDNGFNYFTCSSSSLEKVFMEIVHISERMDHEDADNNLTSNLKTESHPPPQPKPNIASTPVVISPAEQSSTSTSHSDSGSEAVSEFEELDQP